MAVLLLEGYLLREIICEFNSLEDMPELHEIRMQQSSIEKVQLVNLPKLFHIELVETKSFIWRVGDFMSEQVPQKTAGFIMSG